METNNIEVSAPPETFSDQFKHRERIPSFAGQVEYVDITPAETVDKTPILLVEGWGETIETHSKSLKTIFDSKRRAFAVNFPRRGGFKLVGSAPEVELKKASALEAAMSRTGAEKIDVIAHSEGALSTIIAAERNPEKFRNIVFVDPAGLIGKDDRVKLAVRFTHMLTKDAVRLFIGFKGKFRKGIVKSVGDFSPEEAIKPRIAMSKAANESIRYFASNPKRGLQEVSAIAESDIYEMLENLQKLGIGVSVIHGVDDTVFPMKKVLQAAGDKGGMDTVGFYSVKGDHREISVHPEKYTALAVNALEDLRDRKTNL